MKQLTFFTDITTNISKFCLLNVKRYEDNRKEQKRINFIDPSVYELKDSKEYSLIDKLHYLSSGNLATNEFISIDYPCDMNLQFQNEFIEKSIQNNLKYKNNLQYICTIQSKFQNFADFKYQYEYLEEQIDFSQKIIGIGNLCRIMHTNEFTDNVFKFLNEKQKSIKMIHFYGLGMKLIRKYIPEIEKCSIDSTKFTKAITTELKKANGVCCRKHNRDLFFIEYMKTLQKALPEHIIFY